jgi:hypothetical protein
MKTKNILNTEIVKIEQDQNGYRTFVAMQNGGWLEMATFPNELKGLVNALDLATNCAAGKFFPKRIATMTDDLKMINNQLYLEGNK